ncbi:uncharacterized protein LOC117227748 isoform X1 [Megalopta genalis]|uniref:uncharacterized protein LOC117227748 isoform X1 n=1 Tax=Megalopta genalis TaxID=115081 RepID=UPI003FD61E17
MDEVRGLIELPMTELIHIKSSLGDDGDFFEEDEASSRTLSVSLPMALPLKRNVKRNNGRPLRRGDHYEEKGKGDTKISKIFQLAVTALSFLAFGGYLLTLIIMAIRRNSNGMNNGNVIVLSVSFVYCFSASGAFGNRSLKLIFHKLFYDFTSRSFTGLIVVFVYVYLCIIC